jgi:predicted permease
MTLHHALKALKRAPVFSIAVILSLALGIGSVGSMFAIVYGVLLAPLPYAAPARLVSVSLQTTDLSRMQQPPALFSTYKQFAQNLVDIGYYRTGNSNVWREGDAAESVIATWVSASMMPLLGVPPLLGRGFTDEEAIRGGPDAVILSESEWRTRFGAAPDVIGKTIMVNSVARQIVGVMPAQFAFPDADTRLWLPAKHTDSASVGDFSYAGLARLAADATPEQLQRELTALLPKMSVPFPRLDSGAATASWLAELKPIPLVLPLQVDLTRTIARTLWMLSAAAGLVLLVAWANVTNLMLMRADSRQLELRVREALGAGRVTIAAHCLGESLLLGAISGVLALLLTYGAVRMLLAFGPADVTRVAQLGVGLSTFGFVALVSFIGVIICAFIPALRVGQTKLSNKLHDGARGQSAGQSRQRLRASITVVQIGLALVVSLGSALLLRTAHHLANVHPGFEAAEVTTLWTQLPFARYDEAAANRFYARLSERVRQLPFVLAAGVSKRIPLGSGETPEQSFSFGGRTLSLPVNIVDGGYFAAMRIPLRAGSAFGVVQSGEIMLSQHAARTLFGDTSGVSALGKHLTLAAPEPPASYRVIGVVGDVRYRDLTSAASEVIYLPISAPGTPRSMALLIRSRAAPGALIPAIRQILRDLDPTVPIFNVETMTDVVQMSTARLSLVLMLLTTAAVITLVLGAIGLYGVMAYMVALRTREFGVRIALGADPKRIARWVARRALALTVSGVLFGFILYALSAPFLRAFLFGVTASDPATLVATTLVLASTALLASALPAARAARIDPIEALRAE